MPAWEEVPACVWESSVVCLVIFLPFFALCCCLLLAADFFFSASRVFLGGCALCLGGREALEQALGLACSWNGILLIEQETCWTPSSPLLLLLLDFVFGVWVAPAPAPVESSGGKQNLPWVHQER